MKITSLFVKRLDLIINFVKGSEQRPYEEMRNPRSEKTEKEERVEKIEKHRMK